MVAGGARGSYASAVRDALDAGDPRGERRA